MKGTITLSVSEDEEHIGVGVRVQMDVLDIFDRYMLVTSLMKSLDLSIDEYVILNREVGDHLSGIEPMIDSTSTEEMLRILAQQPTVKPGLRLLKKGEIN